MNVNRLSFADTLAWQRYGNLNACPTLIVNPLRPARLEPDVHARPAARHLIFEKRQGWGPNGWRKRIFLQQAK